MPPIPPECLECVVFLYPSKEAAEEGVTDPDLGGTGFLASTPLDPDAPTRDDLRALYVVTNEHVAREAAAVRLSSAVGAKQILTPEPAEWIYPNERPEACEDDLAVLPLRLTTDYPQFSSVPVQARHARVVESADQDFPSVVPGRDAFFAGRYVTLSGKQENQPIARFGSVSMTLPAEPLEREGHPPQESFLVEARSQGGFSGSPVFVYDVASQIRSTMSDLALLGIVWGHLPIERKIIDGEKERPIPVDWYVDENSNMACVVPAWRIIELLQKQEVIDLREEVKREGPTG
jgi:hypothetical protein